MLVPDDAEVETTDARTEDDGERLADSAADGLCIPVGDGCGAVEICGNGIDDNCNGLVDENCPCAPGAVQPCFAGQPGRRHIGACSDGAQTCEAAASTWGPCTGGILPRPDVCNGKDNLCNGCSQQQDCPISCPSPGDSRVRDGTPFTNYALHGGDFYEGLAKSWKWEVKGGPCDDIAKPSFDLNDATSKDAVLFPRLSGDYSVTLTIVTASGTRLTCTWLVHVAGPGLRVEMCYPESETQDLDLFVHKPGSIMPWYLVGATSFYPNPDSCGWFNCEAHIRGLTKSGQKVPRANWGYNNGPLVECENDAYGDEWKALGFCANPRLDIDNNLVEGVGVPENISIDNPRDGQTFRVMVQNFSGDRARPVVIIYCDGRRVGTYGAPPDEVPNYEGVRGSAGVGVMWRVCEVTVHVDSMGHTTGCSSVALHPPGKMSGYDVTHDDPRF
ncbi:MAG: hypothetical protein NVS3B20_05580 [Polyangiales bacterium]